MTRVNLLNFRGPVLIASPEYPGVIGTSVIGDAVRQLGQNLRQQGIRSIVVIPGGCIDTFRGANKVGDLFEASIDGQPVIALASKFKNISPDPATEMEAILEFTHLFWREISEHNFGNISLINAHDWPMGMLFLLKPAKSKGIPKVFTPYSSDRLIHLSPDQIKQWAVSQAFHRGCISGFKAGVWGADLVTMWTNVFMQHLLRDEDGNTYSDFMTDMVGTGNLHKFFVLEHGGHAWTPADGTHMTLEYTRRMEQAYLRAMYGEGYEFSLKIGKYGKSEISTLVISLTEKNPEDERAQILFERMKKYHPDITDIRVLPKAVQNYPGEVRSKGYRGNMGGLVQGLKEVCAKYDGKENGRGDVSLVFLNGGDGERGFVCTLNSCNKGELMLGNKTIGAISQDSAHLIAMQLPVGHAHVIAFGCDNYLMPNGEIKVGDHLLNRAKQGIILFGQQVKLKDVHIEQVDYLKDFGIFFVDPVTGQIMCFGEKVKKDGKFDLKWASDQLDKYGGDSCYINTFFFAFRSDVAVAMCEGLDKKSTLDPRKAMHEAYDLDISNHFTSALFATKEEWTVRFDKEKKGSSKGFAFDDWMYLWEYAQNVKKVAGDKPELVIGGANVGDGKETWSDIGTIAEHYYKTRAILSDNSSIRNVSRQAMGLVTNTNVYRSVVGSVELPKEGECFISRSVFRKGAKIGKNVIIIDSIFDKYVDIPDNTIIVGSRLYHVKFASHTSAEKFIYHVQQDPSEELVVKDNCAYSTIYLINGKKMTGVFPIPLTGKEDSPNKDEKDAYLGHYIKDGKMVEQPIAGLEKITDDKLLERLKAVNPDDQDPDLSRPSVKHIKRLNSLNKTDEVQKELLEDIEEVIPPEEPKHI